MKRGELKTRNCASILPSEASSEKAGKEANVFLVEVEPIGEVLSWEHDRSSSVGIGFSSCPRALLSFCRHDVANATCAAAAVASKRLLG